MKQNKVEITNFKHLKDGSHSYIFELKEDFFNYMGLKTVDREVDYRNTVLNIQLLKKNNLIRLDYKISSELDMICDRTNEPFTRKNTIDNYVILKYGNLEQGEEMQEIDEKLILISSTLQSLDLSWYFYETLMLMIPMKRLAQEEVVLEELEEETSNTFFYTTQKQGQNENDFENIEPRFAKLKDLLK